MKYSDLCKKVVIHTSSGEMMGYISDITLDTKTFLIQTITIEDKGGVLGKILPILFKGKSYCIQTSEITSIGNDVILVESACIKNKKKTT